MFRLKFVVDFLKVATFTKTFHEICSGFIVGCKIHQIFSRNLLWIS
jgi:hypothetical protein